MMTIFTLVALFAIVKPYFDKVCVLTFGTMSECNVWFIGYLGCGKMGVYSRVFLFKNTLFNFNWSI